MKEQWFFYIRLSETLLAIALLFQTIEFWQMREVFSSKGVWRWEYLKDEWTPYPRFIQVVLSFLLQAPNFTYLLGLRLLAAAALFFHSHWVTLFILLVSTLLICLRFRGTFNGGSDYMTLILTMALFLCALFHENVLLIRVCMAYVSVQVVLSYFIAGVVKVKESSWRSGHALREFLEKSHYQTPLFIRPFLTNKNLLKMISWAIIFFECTFPFALLSSSLCLIYLAMGFVFHFLNFVILGLNRFLFIWAASYPIVYAFSMGLF